MSHVHACQTLYYELNTINGTHKGRRQKPWEMLGRNSKTPRLPLDSLLQGEHVEEMMDTFNCFLDLTYPLARPLSAVRICTSSGTVQRQMVQSAQCNTSHLRMWRDLRTPYTTVCFFTSNSIRCKSLGFAYATQDAGFPGLLYKPLRLPPSGVWRSSALYTGRVSR